jgi:hypothetical protein
MTSAGLHPVSTHPASSVFKGDLERPAVYRTYGLAPAIAREDA